jgi:hypothetical protein
MFFLPFTAQPNYLPEIFIEIISKSKLSGTRNTMDRKFLGIFGNAGYYSGMNILINSYGDILGDARYSYIESIPNEIAISNAKKFVNLLSIHGQKVYNMGPFPDGGILFELKEGDSYLSIEFYNENDIVAVLKINNEKKFIQLSEDEMETVLTSFIDSQAVAV